MALLELIASVLSAVALLRLALLVVMAAVDVLTRWRRGIPTPVALPPVAVLVPAYNEERVLAGTIAALLRSDVPDLRVIVIDDGSTDTTLAVARAQAAQAPPGRVQVLAQQPNAGKSAALNAGIQAALGAGAALLVTVDADTVVAEDTVRRLCTALLAEGADAAASNVKVGNRQRWLLRWQSLEYVVGLNLERRAQAALGCITTIPGAACAFQPAALQAAGGFSSDTVVEDTDLTLTLQRAGRRIIYVPEAGAYTEAPADWAGLYRQRRRWLRGYLQCLRKHRAAFFQPTVLGWFGMPSLLFIHVLVYVLVPLSLPPVARLLVWTGWEALAGGLVGLFGAEVALAALAYAVDREDPRDLLHVPLRRLVWPWFLLGVFLSVVLTLRRGGGWGKPDRRGELADLAVEAGGVGVISGRRRASASTSPGGSAGHSG